MSTPDLFDAIHQEFQRLGLDPHAMPGAGLAVDERGIEGLLAHLRAFEPPVSWRDVFPDIPAHWVEGRPETWTTRYRPLGPYDHQSLPTGPAVHIQLPRTTDPSCLDDFVTAARTAGWPIHGAGFVEANNSGRHDAMIILDAGTSQTTLDDFQEWLLARPDVELAAVPRLGNEEYLTEPR